MQDESRARGFDFYTTNLEKKIKEFGSLDFMKNFAPVIDTFHHSGMACRGKMTINVQENNSIRKAQAMKNWTEIRKKQESKIEKNNSKQLLMQATIKGTMKRLYPAPGPSVRQLLKS